VAAGFERIYYIDDLRGVEAEDRFVARRFLPMARTFRGKADADTEVWQDAYLAGALQDEVELARHFQNEHDLESHFLGVECEVDELLVFVAVADDVCLGVVHVREGGDKFGLRSGFEAVVVFFPKLGDLLDHLALLVDFNRINAPVLARVFRDLNRLVESLVDLSDA
jgi:hypothetical protein